MKCRRCDGCGKIADSDDGEPWTMWLDMPLRSSLAVLMGIVKPIDCPDCGGSGVLARWEIGAVGRCCDIHQTLIFNGKFVACLLEDGLVVIDEKGPVHG